MRYVYNSSKRILRDLLYYNKGDGIPTHRPVNLNKKEGQLLMLLSDEELHRYDDICKFIWDLEIVTCETAKGKNKIIDRKTAVNRIGTICSTMIKKTKNFGIEIKCKKRIGIKLITQERIWIQ